jgi:hypothetical protein
MSQDSSTARRKMKKGLLATIDIRVLVCESPVLTVIRLRSLSIELFRPLRSSNTEQIKFAISRFARILINFKTFEKFKHMHQLFLHSKGNVLT